MAQRLHDEPIRIQHAHDETHTLMIFSKPVSNMRFSIEQTEELIRAIQESLAGLRAYQEKLRAELQGATTDG